MMRPATADDAAVMATIEAAAADHPWSEQQLRDTLSSLSGRAWLLDTRGHLVVSQAGPTADILTIAVHPDHRRQGHASALLDHGLHQLSQQGVEELFLEVRTDNTGAIALYTAHGFTEVGQRRRYYSDGQDALVLQRRLP